MEVLMRLAFKRYEESNDNLSIYVNSVIAKETNIKSEAVKMMFEKNLQPVFGHLNLQKWRDERYWNE
jgi:hypothetical protein